jgi:hypothetical protein
MERAQLLGGALKASKAGLHTQRRGEGKPGNWPAQREDSILRELESGSLILACILNTVASQSPNSKYLSHTA